MRYNFLKRNSVTFWKRIQCFMNAEEVGDKIRFFSAWSCLDCFQRGFCDITSIKCNSVTSKIFQKCLIIVPKVWEVTHNVFHHPWHIYQMDFYHFFSSTKDFTFDFSMSHCYTRYRSEEISPRRWRKCTTCSANDFSWRMKSDDAEAPALKFLISCCFHMCATFCWYAHM